MRECGAQGGEGVWNSWLSRGASCSLALQPLQLAGTRQGCLAGGYDVCVCAGRLDGKRARECCRLHRGEGTEMQHWPITHSVNSQKEPSEGKRNNKKSFDLHVHRDRKLHLHLLGLRALGDMENYRGGKHLWLPSRL